MPMPNFVVKYNFTCTTCQKYTDGMVTVNATDMVDAREFAATSAACEHCHQQPAKGTFVSTSVVEQK
jgi:hypothetical protein